MPGDKGLFTSKRYYTKRVLEKLQAIKKSRSCLVCAPSGFGKTTAVRDFLEHQLEDDPEIYWFVAQDEEPGAAWKRLGHALGQIDPTCGQGLLSLGFPVHTNVGLIGQSLRSLGCDRPCYFVLDDFQYLQRDLPPGVLRALLEHGGAQLHLICITQLPLGGADDLPGLLRIGAETLLMDAQDIHAYYALCGVQIKLQQAEQVQELTGGWIIAVYLQLLAFIETKAFASSSDTVNLMRRLIYDKLSWPEQYCLLCLSSFSSFTPQLACHMLQVSKLPDHVSRLLESNPFIQQEKSKRSYCLHAYLRVLLQEELACLDEEQRRHILLRAGDWCAGQNSPFDALTLYFQGQVYERILALALRHMQMVRVDGTPYDLLAQEIVQHCPLTVKQRHPLALLRIAYHLHTCGLLSDYHQLMDELQGIIAQAPDQEQKALQGEWLLVDALGHRGDLPILCAKLEQARRLLPGRSRVLDAWEPFALGVDSMARLFWTAWGQADEIAEHLEQAVELYGDLTGGGIGTDTLYRAELAYYRGDMAMAEVLCHKAIYMAESTRQDTLLLTALKLLAHIAIQTSNLTLWGQALESLEQGMAGSPANPALGQVLFDLIRNQLYIAVGAVEQMAGWQKQAANLFGLYGEAPKGFSLPAGSEHFSAYQQAAVVLVHARYLVESGQFARALGVIELGIKASEKSRTPLLAIQYQLLGSLCHLALQDRLQAKAFAAKAVELVLYDNLLLFLAEMAPRLEGLVEEILQEEGLPCTLQEVVFLQRDRADVLGLLQKAMGGNKLGLTDREYQIALLVAQGKTNREIAGELFISVDTVKAGLKHIFQKLTISRRAELVKLLA